MWLEQEHLMDLCMKFAGKDSNNSPVAIAMHKAVNAVLTIVLMGSKRNRSFWQLFYGTS